MIEYQQALDIILNAAQPLPAKRVETKNALGLSLSESIHSPNPMPLFDNAAMDGYGVRALDVATATKDTPVSLTVQETLQAGQTTSAALKPGHAFQVFTGAPLPDGVDAVVMQEFTRQEDDTVFIQHPVQKGDHIRYQGEEFEAGHGLLKPGVPLTPARLGLLASVGLAQVKVTPRPCVAIVTTGNELVEPGHALKPGQIYDSNGIALEAALTQLGITTTLYPRALDTPEALQHSLAQGLAQADVLITVGGVSVGKYDLVKTTLEALGVTQQFWKIAIKPGKPVFFGTYGEAPASKLIFGLPGNPVSALLTFHQLVKPALEKMAGQPVLPLHTNTARLTAPLKKRPGRLEFVRGMATCHQGQWHVTPTTGQGSHMLSGLADANCLILFPLEASLLEAEQPVAFTWLEPNSACHTSTGHEHAPPLVGAMG